MIDRIHELLISIQNVRFQIDTLALKALFLDMQGDESAAVNALTQSLAIAEPGGFVRPFVDLGSPMADLLKKCIKQNIAVSYIGHILGAFRDENKKAIRNGAMRPAAQTALVGSQPLVEQLTVREQEILNLLVGRLSNKEIAAKLFIAPTTVKKHLNNIYGKLGVSNRRQAVEKSEALGILSSR
jgi:LuxR family maltose regulon positive regulatory protein